LPREAQAPAGSPAAVKATAARARAALDALVAVVVAHQPSHIVIGLPLLLSGERGEAALAVDAFAAALRKRTDAPVELWDERFTSSLAEQSLREEGRTSGKRRGGGREKTRTVHVDKSRIDMRAALLLLQSWLDAHPEGP